MFLPLSSFVLSCGPKLYCFAHGPNSLTHVLKHFGETPVIANHDSEHGHPQLADGWVQRCQA